MNAKELQAVQQRIALQFKQYREALGVSQAELAKRTGVSIATIKRIELATQWPGLKQVVILADALGKKIF